MRIVAISDLHGQLIKNKMPKCDVLVVAGDVCPDTIGGLRAKKFPQTQLAWFANYFAPWIEQQLADFILVTWGNHDFCGQMLPNAQIGKRIDVVSDGPVMVDGVKFWLTPWSNQFFDWAFMRSPQELNDIYSLIPEDVDVLVSHQPPYGFKDMYPNLQTGQPEHVGSVELLAHIDRVKPKVVICGHLHDGHGAYVHGDTRIYNVSLLNEAYQHASPATIIDL